MNFLKLTSKPVVQIRWVIWLEIGLFVIWGISHYKLITYRLQYSVRKWDLVEQTKNGFWIIFHYNFDSCINKKIKMDQLRACLADWVALVRLEKTWKNYCRMKFQTSINSKYQWIEVVSSTDSEEKMF